MRPQTTKIGVTSYRVNSDIPSMYSSGFRGLADARDYAEFMGARCPDLKFEILVRVVDVDDQEWARDIMERVVRGERSCALQAEAAAFLREVP